MPTYSEWLDSTRALYTTAMTNAFNNRNNPDTDNSFYKAWQAMNSVGDLTGILPTNTAFYGASPDGDEADILLFQGYLQENPVVAGWLSLEPTLTFRADQRSSLGSAGTVGGQKRRWKGNPVYTFANGVLIGKDNQIVAAIGTEGGEDLDGFGTDTIAYFDGVPFATGTGVPGSVVFRGDTVVSGSIKGTGGVVIIDDVIQLETGVDSPAGIGVDSDGKIRLRHRGEGFIDLVDEINTVQANVDGAADTAANIAKLWQGVQNTSSAQWGTSLIPNSNFSFKTVDPTDGYSDRLVGVISVGTTNNIVTIPADGVCGFQGLSQGICLQAVPIESERYAIRIRYRGATAETLDSDGTEEGLFLSFHETTDSAETIGDNTFVYDNSTPGAGYEGSSVHTSNVTVNYPTNTTSSDGGGAIDGVTIQETYQVKSFVYEPNAGTTAASLVIYTKNYVDLVSIDYVVMTESPLTTTEVDGLITTAVGEIDVEVDDPDISVVTDPQMKDYTLWAGYNGATLANGTDGLTTGGDAAITVSVPSGGGGIVSSAIACESDRYLVGAKVRVLSSVGSVVPNVSMFAIENPNQVFSTIGNASTTPLSFPSGNNVLNNIDIVKLDSSGTPDVGGAGSDIAIPIAELDGSEPLYTTFVGTYEVNVVYVGTDGTEYETFNPSIQTTAQLPSVFSLVVYADTECELSVDYVYGRLQGASVNIAQALADTAYTDAHGFVTAMNEQLIKESGSIITNASMAILDSNNNPSGWRTDIASGTLTLDSTGDNSIKITQEGVQTGTRRLITPTFNLGTADKFSVGISVRGISSAINVTTKVAVCTDSILPSSYVTIAASDGGNADVLVLNVTESSIDGPTAVAANGTDAYENILVTWNRGDVQQTHGGMGSIIIEADNDFEVDFVFVKEQTVSYNLADAQAVARREEAIRSAAGFVSSIGDSLADEAGSFITNAAFTSWYLDSGSGKQRPQKWLATRGASSVVRAITSTEVVIDEPADLVTAATDKETVVTNKGINGSALRFDPGTSSGGILSSKFQLPVSSSWTNPDTSAVETTTGSYTLSVRLKLDSANLVGVRLYAHELFSLPTGTENHVFCEDGSYGDTNVEGADRSSTGAPLDELKMFADTTEGTVQRIKVINVATNDVSVGYDGTADGNADDEYIEYLPVDTGEDDGDRDATFNQNVDVWYDISGTYKPHEDAKVVSFEILIEGDPDSGDTAPLIYVDYVSLITQPFDTDFAQTLADARAESIATIKTGELSTTIGLDNADWTGSSYFGNTSIAELLIATRNDVDAVETALATEDPASTLIPNSFFGSPETGTSVDDWIPTRSTTGTITRTNTSANGSYGSYITLGSTPAGEEIHGLLSKAISVLGDGTTTTGLIEGGLAQNPNFDVVIRYRADSTEQVSWQMIAHEFYSDSLTGQNQYVFENGYGNLVSGQSGVELFNGGVTGNAVVLSHIFTDNDTTTESESSSASTNWLTLVGTYKPTANARWVSFEFVLNEDKDDDDILPSVQIDGILLQQSTVDGGLAASIQATAEAAQLAADNAQTTADGNATDISNNSGLITINIGGISTNADGISTNSGAISTNTGNISSIQTSVALMKAADTELFLIQTAMANETDSKIPNAAFLQPTGIQTTNDDGDAVPNLAIPGSFLQFQETGYLFRATNEYTTNTPITSAYTNLGTYSLPNSVDTPYYDVGQNGTALIVPGTSRNQDYVGFYTSAVIIPNAGDSGTSSGTQDPATGDNDFTGELTFTSRGQYTISFKVKNLSNVSSESITVQIRAHEYVGGIGPATEAGFITAAAEGSSSGYDGGGTGTSSGIGTTYTSDNDQVITIIKLSDASDTTFGSSETLAQGSGWVTIGGTYTASADCECVSFSLWVEIDDDNDDVEAYDDTKLIGMHGSSNLYPALAVDFIYCASQSFTADMAEQITASRVYTVQQTLETNIETLEDNLGAESDSLMPNGNFAQKFTDSSVDYVKNWLPTGDSSADKLQLYAADSASKSIGTYVKFNKNASGGSAPYGANKSGIISKAIMNPVEIVRDLDGNINAFNIGMRIRGTTDETAASMTGPTNSTNTTTGNTYSGNVGYNADVDPSAGFNNDGLDYRFTSLGDGGALRTTGESGGTATEYHRIPNPVANPNSSGHTKQWLLFYVAHTDPDGSWQLYIRPSAGTSKLSTVNATIAYISNDNGLNWTSQTIVSGQYIQSNSSTISSSITTNASLVMVQFEHSTPGTLLPSNFDYVQVFAMSSGSAGYFWIGRQARWFSFTPTTVPNFTVKVISHETFEAVADPNIIVRGPLVDMDSTNIPTDVGVTVPTAFSSGVSTELNLIDLRYSGSSPGTEITIDASLVNDDSGEAITDWRHIVGSYTPNEAATAVSFEILIDHEPDEVSPVQEVWLDSITMAVSSVGTDLAQTIADQRVFVEQNFQGGSTPVSPNNVIVNADMSGVFLDGTTKRPQNWAYWSTEVISGGYDNIFVSPDSTTTNRAITFKKGTTYAEYYGIISRPFRITSEKYKIRIVYNVATGSSTASGTSYMVVSAITYDSELSDAADSIILSSMNMHPTSSAYITAAGVASTYTNQSISNVERSFDGTITTVDLTWTPITQTTTTRPNASDLPRYASIRLGLHSSTSGFDINIWEISAVPEGGQYSSYQFGSGETKAYGTDFDDDGDVLPDAPRETEAKTPLYQSIDIQVSDTTQASPPKNRLLMALPRKYFPENNSTDPSGTSFLYPGVSDLEYLQNETDISLLGVFDLGGVGDSRHLIFPSTTHNTIKEVSMISFQKDEDPTGNIDPGWFNPAVNSGSQRTASGAQIIDRLGGLWFDEQYEPGGWTGDEVYVDGKYHGPRAHGGTRPTGYINDETYVNSVGSHIANVKSIYVGTNWNYHSTNAKAPPFWDAYISSDISSANLNGYGTTLGNTTTLGTGAKAENVDLAKYNRMGGIYIKQTNHAHGVHCIKYNGESRWAMGMGRYGSTDTESLYFHYATDESTSPLSQAYILYNRTAVEGTGTLLNFTGQHRCEDLNDSLASSEKGLIVVSTGRYNNLNEFDKPTINSALPIVELSSKRNQKSCFGVLSDKEDRNGDPREYSFGNFVSVHHDEETLDRLIINSLGEGAVWICNINGDLENGDYITTCEIPGYGMRQDDDLLHNYTVAKITQDCTFELDNPYYDCVEFEFEGNTYRKAFVGCTYHCG